jgi:WD40 repeat protein
MVTGSFDETLCLRDLNDGVVRKKMTGHCHWVRAVEVSRDGGLVASADEDGKLIAWHRDTCESLTQPINAHFKTIISLNFSPDGTVLATGSWDKTTKLWSTISWQMQGDPINCVGTIYCVQFSPSGELLAIATEIDIEIWDPRTRFCVAKFKAAINEAINYSLAWTPDGKHLLSAGFRSDPTIRQWDASTWQQVGDPWSGHTDQINALAMNSTGTFVASASPDHVRLWRFSDRQTVAIFNHSGSVLCVTFSTNGKYIFSGGADRKISEWTVPLDALLKDAPTNLISQVSSRSFPHCCGLISPNRPWLEDAPKGQATRSVSSC